MVVDNKDLMFISKQLLPIVNDTGFQQYLNINFLETVSYENGVPKYIIYTDKVMEYKDIRMAI